MKAQSVVDLLRLRSLSEPEFNGFTFFQSETEACISYSYRELEQRARSVAAWLQAAKLPGARVLIILPTGFEYLVAFFGTLYARMVAVPLFFPDPSQLMQQFSRISAIIKDSAAQVIITHRLLLQQQALLESTFDLPKLIWLDLAALANQAVTDYQELPITSETLALLQYTSGSTGQPKGVMITHANLLSNLEFVASVYQHDSEYHVVSWLPLYHNMGLLGGVLQPLFARIKSTLLSPVDFLKQPVHWLKLISGKQKVITIAPNFAYDLCVARIQPEERAALDLRGWQIAMNGSEPVKAGTMQRFAAVFAAAGFKATAFTPCYGLSEATLLVAYRRAGKALSLQRKALEINRAVLAEAEEIDAIELVAVGVGSSTQQLIIVNPETRELCQADQVGEIWLAGASVSPGYWQNERETQHSFGATLADGTGSFLRTGDLGFLHQGELLITGRLKEMIIINGRNIYPLDVEGLVETSVPVVLKNNVVAFGIETGKGESLAILAELDPAQSEESYLPIMQMIATRVFESLGVGVATVALLAQGSLPKTANGKLPRRICQKLWLDNKLESLAVWTPQATQQVKLHVNDLPQTRVHETRNLELIREWLIKRVAEVLKLAPESLDQDLPLASYGFGSSEAVSLVGELEALLGQSLSPSLFYNYPSINALLSYLAAKQIELGEAKARQLDETEQIALIGMGVRFPGGANTPEQYWELLAEGVSGITAVPSERRKQFPAAVGVNFAGGYLEEIYHFEPEFFNLSLREARCMDPQHRLLLECSWEALEDAAINPLSLAGSNTGVFIGLSSNDYGQIMAQHPERADVFLGVGNSHTMAANRISYHFDLKGPSMAIDTACSSSLVSLHLACESLRRGETELAIVGGANAILTAELTRSFALAGMLAPDGCCKTFDQSANGYVRGEGCGVVILKPLRAAVRDGNPIRAVIRGTAVGQDGRSNGLTAPNGLAQQQVIRTALARAGVNLAELGYLEAHGTGTALGDPIEVEALQAVYGAAREGQEKLWLGSVKTNLGHLEAAAGIAGLTKVVLSLEKGKLPPHLHLAQPNQKIAWEQMSFRIPQQLEEWQQSKIAGVSSFGFGGTNAHVILEAAPARAEELPEELPVMISISARQPAALQELVTRYLGFLEQHPAVKLADFSKTLHLGRVHCQERLAIVTSNREELLQQLQAVMRAEKIKGVLAGKASLNRAKIAFLFTGQGSQYVGMGRELYQTEPVFRAALDECATILGEILPHPILEVIFGTGVDPKILHQTEYTQPALFALEYALYQLWRSWGVEPELLLGHSVGEYVAACVAGVFSLEDGLRLIVKRAQLMQSLAEPGAMAVVFAGEAEVRKELQRGNWQVELAAVNGPENVVISGAELAVVEAIAGLSKLGLSVKRLEVSQGFHSAQLEPILNELATAVAEVKLSSAQKPIVSNLTGEIVLEELTQPDYWQRQARETVRFAQGMETLKAEGCQIFIEIGPAPVLIGMGRRAVAIPEAIWVSSLQQGKADAVQIRESVAALYTQGVMLDWQQYYQVHPGELLHLPTYPFQRQKCCISEELEQSAIDEYRLQWEAAPLIEKELELKGNWLILADNQGYAKLLEAEISGAGGRSLCLAPPEVLVKTENYLEQFFQRVKEIFGTQPLAGLINLWGLNDALVDDYLELNLNCFLQILQQWSNYFRSTMPPVWLITDLKNPFAACLAGLGRVLANEQPESWGGLLEFESLTPKLARLICQELMVVNEKEVQLRWRGEQRSRLRLQREPKRSLESEKLNCTEAATYLITGGNGSIGLRLAEYLSSCGAGCLLLLNRQAPSTEAQAVYARLAARTRVVHRVADVTDEMALSEALKVLDELPPLKGVFHVAGILRDGVLLKQAPAEFLAVLKTKAVGAWNLHQATLAMQLDYFVMFSSVASIFGTPGQGGYVAGNTFLDYLVQLRRQAGLPALSLNWGPWEGSQMVSSDLVQERFASLGMGYLKSEAAWQALARALREAHTQLALFELDWERFRKVTPRIPKLLEYLVVSETEQKTENFRVVLQQTPVKRRNQVLSEWLQRQVGMVLGIEKPSRIGLEQGFMELGLNSLMVLELRNQIQQGLELTALPGTVIFERPNIKALAEYLMQEIFFEREAAATGELTEDLLTELENLTEAEAAELLAEYLASKKD